MSGRKLFSSDEIIAALQRAGFELAHKSGGHQALKRLRPDGSHDVTVVPLSKPEVAKGTFEALLKLANVSYDDFLIWAKVKTKGRRAKRKY